MAFFDDDPPTQQRRSSGPPPPPRPPRRPSHDAQTVRRNRFIAGGLGAFLLLLAAVILHGCVNSAHVNGTKNYNEKVNELAQSSASNVSEGIGVLTKTSANAIDQSQQLSDLARDSDKLTESARKLSTPGGLEGATQNVATALSLRATALKRMGQLIGKAKGTSASESQTATTAIAGQMEALLASDVLWTLRVTPFIKEKFNDYNINSTSVGTTTVLKDSSLINVAHLSTLIGGNAPDAEAQDPTVQCVDGEIHGQGIASVSANSKVLGSGINTVPSSSGGTSFSVVVDNQGQFDESNVSVTVTGKPKAGGAGFSKTQRLLSSPKGKQTPVVVNVKNLAHSYDITVALKKVSCEKNLDNNKMTFSVIFG